MCIPVAHVEAGLRSGDRTMPEEINRLVTDALSDFCLTPSRDGNENLLREGVPDSRIFFVGNVMVDTLKQHLAAARSLPTLDRFGLREPDRTRPFALLTLHRPSNVDQPETLAAILREVQKTAALMPVIFPVHPRTRERLRGIGAEYATLPDGANAPLPAGMYLAPPLGYLQFLGLMAAATAVITDSGGIQEETTAVGVPCFTLRPNTERPITISEGTNTLLPQGASGLESLITEVLEGRGKRGRIPELWDGHAAERIAAILKRRLTGAE
jgi:UDP-N-acetylglucosamine 2-epimerase (non-hydrolysing)